MIRKLQYEFRVEPVELSGINLYDLRINCTKPPLCYDFLANVASYLNSPTVQAALGVKSKWQDCNRVVTIGVLVGLDARFSKQNTGATWPENTRPCLCG